MYILYKYMGPQGRVCRDPGFSRLSKLHGVLALGAGACILRLALPQRTQQLEMPLLIEGIFLAYRLLGSSYT